MEDAPGAVSGQPRPAPAAAQAADSSCALEWAAVLEAEYEALYGKTPFEAGTPSDPDARVRALHLLLHQRRPTALCLSGGGIRSATFGLGVVQALARVGGLGQLDYLSTVSGGGYVGGWLTTWLHRDGPDAVIRGLDPSQAAATRGEAARFSPVDRLRATCRYLAPRGGVVSADVWTLLTTMARNLVLNWLVLLP
nr:patatin-like phospholipase family protein [Acidobacteriota bacterium]